MKRWVHDRRRWQRTILTLAAVVLPVSGCDGPVTPNERLVPGTIFRFQREDPRITTDVVGNSLTVTVQSFGNGCRKKGRLDVSVAPDVHHVSVSVFDWEYDLGFCPDYEATFDHSATIELEDTGVWIIAFHGQDVTGNQVIFPFIVESPTQEST